MNPGSNRRDILSLRFNQEQNLFACSTDAGLRVYNVEPLMVKTCLGKLFIEKKDYILN